MTETMVMTWIILGSGVAMIAMSAPYAVPELAAYVRRRQRPAAA